MVSKTTDQAPIKIEAILATQTSNATASPPAIAHTTLSPDIDVLRLSKRASRINIIAYGIGFLALVGAVLQLTFKDHEDVFAWAVVAFGVLTLATTIWVQRITSTIEAKREAKLAEFRAQAISEIEHTRNQLEQERRDRALLQQRLGPRVVSEAQREAMLSALSNVPNSTRVEVFLQGEPEPDAYARQMIAVLQEAGVRITERRSKISSTGANTGVQVSIGHGAGADTVRTALGRVDGLG
jgi:uncharacterized membrane protein